MTTINAALDGDEHLVLQLGAAGLAPAGQHVDAVTVAALRSES